MVLNKVNQSQELWEFWLMLLSFSYGNYGYIIDKATHMLSHKDNQSLLSKLESL